jgi:hypothetical protein
MTTRPTAPLRLVLTSLAAAGALATTAGAAVAQQYYVYEEDYYPRAYRYYERYAPRAPAPVAPHALGRAAAREFGLSQIDRTVRSGSTYVIDGQAANGRRTRLIFDVYSGELIDSIRLPDARRETPRVARVDPSDEERPAPRIVPHPPERPASLRPPARASAPPTVVPPSPAAPARAPQLETPVEKPPARARAPATIVPPSPAAPPRAPEPEKPAETPPASASAPATIVPPSPAAPPRAPEPEKPAETPPASASAPATLPPVSPATPPAPTPGPVNPETGVARPTLVNPSDVRGSEEPDRAPPLARADPSGITVAPVEIPPVQLEDLTPSQPRPETPAVPVAPLD